MELKYFEINKSIITKFDQNKLTSSIIISSFAS